jgi:hypothetical protein
MGMSSVGAEDVPVMRRKRLKISMIIVYVQLIKQEGSALYCGDGIDSRDGISRIPVFVYFGEFQRRGKQNQ